MATSTEGVPITTQDLSVETMGTYIERHLDRLNVPGAALAIVEGDRIVHLRGFGQARPDGAAPTPHTPFILGSTTKSFTALAVMQLVEGGKVELDAPVQRYLPWFRVSDRDASARITVRHLLNQTSGLPQLPGVRVLADMDQTSGARERQARALATLKLTRQPGDAFEYSNLNYDLLGLIVEAVAGGTYEAYVEERIFKPLDMQHSYTSRAEAERHDLAVGHRYWFSTPVSVPDLPVPRGSVPAGYLISCTEDMARYLIAYLNRGRNGDSEILSAQGIEELHRPAASITVMGRSVGSYAMGWFVEDVSRTRILWHDGLVPDFYSYMALVPGQKRGIVLLTNANHLLMTLALREVAAGLGALLAGHEPRPIRLGLIPWALRALPLIPALQVVGIASALRQIGRGGGRVRAPIPNLLPTLPLAAMLRTRTLRALSVFMPDVSLIALISGGLALLWSFANARLIVRRRGPCRRPARAGSGSRERR